MITVEQAKILNVGQKIRKLYHNTMTNQLELSEVQVIGNNTTAKELTIRLEGSITYKIGYSFLCDYYVSREEALALGIDLNDKYTVGSRCSM